MTSRDWRMLPRAKGERMRNIGLRVIALLAAINCHGQEKLSSPAIAPSEVAEILSGISASQRLESLSTGPYHLAADFETFDIEGHSDGRGTLDAYWDGKNRWRRTVTYKGATQTMISNSGIYQSSEPFHSSAGERLLISSLLDPIPRTDVSAGSPDFVIEGMKAGQLDLRCAVLRTKRPVISPDPTAYCVESGHYVLRLSEQPGHESVIFNQTERFGAKLIPRTISVRQGKIERGRLNVLILTEWQPDDQTFMRSAGMIGGGMVRSSDTRGALGVSGGAIITAKEPRYPDGAAVTHISGTVVIACVINRQGAVSDAEVLSSPYKTLAKAALEAVQQWVYKPYVVDGQPTEVETTIDINFNLGP